MYKKPVSILIFVFISLYVLQVSASIAPMQSVPVETILQNFNTENTEYIHIPKTDSEKKTNILPESVSTFYKELFATQSELIQAPEDMEDELTFFNFTPKGVRELTYNGNRRGFLVLENNMQVSYPYAIKYDDFMQIRNNKHISTTGFYVPKRLKGNSFGSGDGTLHSYLPTSDDVVFTIGKSTYNAPDEKEIDSNPEIVPYIDTDTERTMIPLRCLAEELEFSVDWNEKEQKVILEKDGYIIVLRINSRNVELQCDDMIQSFETDAAAVIQNDRTFVPFRFVAEAFGCQVHYIHVFPDTQVSITKETEEYAASQAYTYPFINGETYEIGLKTYNMILKPYSLGNQLNINIYDMGGKRKMTRTMEKQPKEQRFVFAEPDIFSIIMPELNRLEKNATYYADIRFTPSDKTIYRIFFDVQ